MDIALSRGVCAGVFLLLAASGCAGKPATATPTPPASPRSGATADRQVPPPKTPVADAGSSADDRAATIADAAAQKTAASAHADAEAPQAPEGMLLVPGGPFTMGSDKAGERDERPAHTVTVAAFWLDRTEVTNEAYAECVAAKVCKPPAEHELHKVPQGRPQQPVAAVSWFDAKKYCEWKGKRLPREAEFEKAARGTDARRYPWGDDAPTKERTCAMGAWGPDDVGSHPAGRGPYGHDDLAGNVWEWMEDEYDPFAYTRPTASEGEPGTCKEILEAIREIHEKHSEGFTGTNPINECEHVIRGGAYNYPAYGIRSSNRIHHPGWYKLVMTGFRCAKDAQ